MLSSAERQADTFNRFFCRSIFKDSVNTFLFQMLFNQILGTFSVLELQGELNCSNGKMLAEELHHMSKPQINSFFICL